MPGIRQADKIDLFILPIVFLFRMAYSILSLLHKSICIKVPIWTLYIFIRLSMFSLYTTFHIIRLNTIFLQSSWLLIMFWPRFYWHLFGPSSNGRSIFNILKYPTPSKGKCTKNIKPRMTALWEKYYVLDRYQLKGSHAHLNQKQGTDLDQALEASTSIEFKDDPLSIIPTYNYLLKRLPKPPDGPLLRILAFLSITSIFTVPTIKAVLRISFLNFISFHPIHQKTLVSLAFQDIKTFSITLIFSSRIKIFKPEKLYQVYSFPTQNLSSNYHIKHQAFTTNHKSSSDVYSFDTDGIPFIIDNSATGIICNDRSLFERKFKRVQIPVTTCSGTSSKPQYIGNFRCELVDDNGICHKYIIPDAVYDPDSSYNLIGVTC